MTEEIKQTVSAVLDGAPPEQAGTPPVPAASGGPPVPNAPKTAAKKRKAKKKIKRIIALVVVLALLGGGGWALWYFVFRDTVEQGEMLTSPVSINTIQSKVEGSGNAVAKDMAAVNVSASGTVQEVYINQGDTVSQGDLLYTVVSPAAQEAVTAAEKGIRDAEKGVRDAEKGVTAAQEGVLEAQERVQEARDAVPDAEDKVKEAEDGVLEAQAAVKDAQDAVTEAQAGVAEANEAVLEAQAELAARQKELAELQASAADLTVAAPFAGKLISVEDITVGSKLEAGAPVAVLANDKAMKLSLYFSYAYADSVYIGQRASVSVPDMTLSCSGTVSAINKISLVSPEGGILFEAVIDVANPGALTEELTATAVLAAADGSDIYPYDDGKLAYSETVTLTTKLAGPVTSKALLKYADVAKGQVLLIQGSDDLDEQITAKQKEVRSAEKAVEAAQKGVTTAQKGVETAQKGVETAQKGVETAQKNVEAMKKGVEAAQKGITDAQKGVTQAQEAVADAQQGVLDAQQGVLDAQAKLEEAQKALEDLNAVAPIDGTVISCTISPGQEVKGGDTVMTISNTTQMSVEIKVDDQNIGFVQPGMAVELSNYDGQMWMGTVTNIDMNPSSDNIGSGVTNYPVTLTVDNFDNSLLSGQWLQYSFVASQSEDCMVIPIQAVKSTMDEEGNDITVVFLQADSRPDNAVSMPEQSPDTPKKYPTEDEGFYAVPVTTGLSDTYNVEIRSGLNVDDVVFTNYLSASGDSWGMYG